MNETVGVLIAILSSTFGGTAAAVTRYVVGTIDPVTLAAFRFGIGFLVLLPLALMLRSALPRGRDWIGVCLLGVMFFAVFFVFYNIAMAYTTAARGALALSTLPLWTMVVAALLGAEALTARKTLGVLIAVGGVAVALAVGLASAPPGAWRGDLIMVGATLCMGFYNVWSRPFIARSSPLGFVTASMGAGAACLVVVAAASGGFAVTRSFDAAQWIAVLYLGAFGGAAAFFLWVLALRMTTPTRVANTMTVNPIAASLLAAVIVAEPIGWNLVVGLIAVGAGIWLASTGASVWAQDKKMSRAKALLGCLDTLPSFLDFVFWAVLSRWRRQNRAVGLSLPRLGPLRRACGSSPLVPTGRIFTLTHSDCIVITTSTKLRHKTPLTLHVDADATRNQRVRHGGTRHRLATSSRALMTPR